MGDTPGGEGTRRIFIGDIQGCRVELERLLEKLGFDPASDQLHPVGDLVNRGPDSLGTLRLLSGLDAGGVLGNHDLHLLQRHAGTRTHRPGDTLEDVLEAPDSAELLAWLAARPFLLDFGDLYLVHAGLSPLWSDPLQVLEGADPFEPDLAARFAVSVRTCDQEGEQPPRRGGDKSGAAGAAERFRPWHTYYDSARAGGRTVVFGHWAAQRLFVAPGLRGLDTGCVWGGELTAWIAEEDRLVSVPAERAYAPHD